MAGLGVSIEGLSTVNWDRLVEPRIQDFQVAVAEQALKGAVANGFDPNPTVITDGVANRDWHDVKPFGKIEWQRKATSLDAARWILDELRRRSPIGDFGSDRHPGLYARSHILLIDGTQATVEELANASPRAVIQIANIQPYAAKIEGRDAFTRWDAKRSLKNKYGPTRRGIRLRQQRWSRGSIAGQSSQAPDGVYRVVLAEAKARFGRTLQIDYAPVLLNLGARVWGQSGGRHSRGARKRIPRPQVYPCFTLQSKSLFA